MQRVVIVDDNRIDRLIIKTALESNDIEVVMVGDPESAVQTIVSFMPDVVILDVNLQDGITGFDLIVDIKATPEIKSIPVIFISSTTDGKNEAQLLGCVDYIDKPLDVQSLVSSVQKYSLLSELSDLWSKVKKQARKKLS